MNIPVQRVRNLVIVGVVLLLAWFYWPFQAVPTGSRGVLTQFGAIKSIEPEGLTLVWPWQRLYLFSIRAETADIDHAVGATADVQEVKTDLTIRYSIDPARVSEVFEHYSHDGDLQSYVQTATQEVFKAVTAKYVAVDLVGKRAEVSASILDALKAKLDKYGALVINVDMRNFTFDKKYMDAILDKVTQEQLKLAADNKVKTVTAEQRQVVVIAEAERDAKKARADGEAYALLANAKAQAQALQIQNEALAKNRDVLELRRIEVDMTRAQKWDGKLPGNIYAGAPIPFLNTNP